MSPNKEKAPRGRIDVLDGWRTLAVLFMVLFHFLWDLERFTFLPAGTMSGAAMSLWRDGVGYSFILLSGISCRFSRSNVRRAVRTLACAGIVTGVSVVMGQPIRFGVLHLLGCGMLLYAGVGKRFCRWNPIGAGAVCLLLFAVTKVITDRMRVTVPGLWILGLRTESFASMDYYPLIPWLFLFFSGAAIGGGILQSDGAWKEKKLPAALTFPGRHALWIYLLHQPILYGLVWLIARK